jgi:predicted AlkP superfamily pyrophosphatase or phosphodiesterase
VLDGLRPDAISAELTPNLYALRSSGVAFSASHSIFPMVTRVAASAIVTGRYPAANGIIGNVIYAPAAGCCARYLHR